MIKKIIVITLIIAVTGILIFGAVNRSLAMNGRETTDRSSESSDELAYGSSGNRGNTGDSDPYDVLTDLPAASGELDATEKAALLYMREEEKLAYDVYMTLYSQWSLPMFQNIAASEQTHIEAVKTLLDRYALADPASDQIGVFSDPTLQELYAVLVGRGSQSLEEALKVGAAIEEIDILDLQERLAKTDQADIQQVFQNLLKGSENHLRSFVAQWQSRTRETYQAQYMSQTAFQAIMGASNNNRRQGNQGQRGSGGQGQSGKP